MARPIPGSTWQEMYPNLFDEPVIVYWWQIVSDHDAWDWQQSICVAEGCEVEIESA